MWKNLRETQMFPVICMAFPIHIASHQVGTIPGWETGTDQWLMWALHVQKLRRIHNSNAALFQLTWGGGTSDPSCVLCEMQVLLTFFLWNGNCSLTALTHHKHCLGCYFPSLGFFKFLSFWMSMITPVTLPCVSTGIPQTNFSHSR